jgi:hypothetical protein
MTTAQEVQQWGAAEMVRVSRVLILKCGIYDEAAGLWAWCVWNAGSADVLDIGTAHGASAILAARVKQRFGYRGTVFTLDDFSAQGKFKSSPDIVMTNFSRANVRVTLNYIPGDHDFGFGAVLIDGGHNDKQPLEDWQKHGALSMWVMFHDSDLPAVRDAIAIAKENPNYVIAADRNNCVVFRRIYA